MRRHLMSLGRRSRSGKFDDTTAAERQIYWKRQMAETEGLSRTEEITNKINAFVRSGCNG